MLKSKWRAGLCLGLLSLAVAKAGWPHSSAGRTAGELAHPRGWEDDDGQDASPAPRLRATPRASAAAGSNSPQAESAPLKNSQTEPDPLTAELQELIHRLGGEPPQRQQAIERLVMIGQPAVKPLQAALADDYKFTRIGALSALGYLRSQEVLADIEKSLQDPEYEVRAEALMTIGKMRAQSATPAVLAARSDKHPRVRRAAVMALGRLKNAQACGALIAYLEDPAMEVRRQAAQELSAYAGVQVVRALIGATRDADAETCAFAVRALGEIGDPGAKPRLQELLASRSRFVREEAAAALQNLSESEKK